MGRLSGFKYKEIAKKLRLLGFSFLREARGSHEIWYNKDADVYTTVPKHRGDMPEGTLRSILKQSGVEPEDFLDV